MSDNTATFLNIVSKSQISDFSLVKIFGTIPNAYLLVGLKTRLQGRVAKYPSKEVNFK